MSQTLYDKIWQQHLIHNLDDGTSLVYIDRHLVHEVTSPQAFEGLEMRKMPLHSRGSILATADHNVPTENLDQGVTDPESKVQIEELDKNAKKYDLNYFGMNDARQGIVHIIGPEQGFTQPGMTLVCGDSHTSTHGAFGALAFGIGTSEIEHVLATQTLVLKKSKNMRIRVEGEVKSWLTAKDIVLYIIAQIGIAGGTGHVIEYCGSVIDGLSMEGRMTLCNMSIEAGARAGLVAPDQTTFDYLKGKPMSPKDDLWTQAVTHWTALKTDDGAMFDKDITLDISDIAPYVTWGTNPEMVGAVTDNIPSNASENPSTLRALEYMGLTAGMPIEGVEIDQVFIGSCTNARIEDLRAAAVVAKGRHVSNRIKRALVVPGSGLVKRQAEDEGLDIIFKDAGFEWRSPGCSMCLAMNADRLEPEERCASTSNRNFEGRQGRGGRTHLMSPAMAAAAAVTGKITDVRGLK